MLRYLMNLLATNMIAPRAMNKRIALRDLLVSSCCIQKHLLCRPQAARFRDRRLA